MSAPVISTTATGADGATSKTSRTVTLPTGIASGNMLVMVVGYQSSGGGTGTINTPTGWTAGQTGNITNSLGTGIGSHAFFYKIATGTEGTSLSLSTTKGFASWWVARITGNDTGTNPASARAADNTGGNGTPTPPSLTPSWGSADNLWLACLAFTQSSPSGNPSAFTFDFSGQTSGIANWVAISELSATAASESPGAWGSMSSVNGWGAFTIAVKPVSAVTNPKTLTVSAAATGTLPRLTSRNVIATAHGAATMLHQAIRPKVLTTAAGATVTMLHLKAIGKVLSTSAHAAVSLPRSISRRISTSAAATGTVSHHALLHKTLSVAAAAISVLPRRTNRSISTSAHASVTLPRRINHTISATVGLVATIVHTFQGGGGAVFNKTLIAAAGATATVRRLTAKTLTTSGAAVAHLPRRILRSLSTSAHAVGTLSRARHLLKVLSVSAAAVPSVRRQINKTLRVSVGLIATIKHVASNSVFNVFSFAVKHKQTGYSDSPSDEGYDRGASGEGFNGDPMGDEYDRNKPSGGFD